MFDIAREGRIDAEQPRVVRAGLRLAWLFTERRMVVAAVLLLGLLSFVWPLTVPFALLDPDEALHAAIAQEMLERGAWLTPTFLGQAFWDKPILFFWTEIASLRVIGQTEAGVRLPGLLFDALGVFATGLLARDLYGRRAGLVTAVCYATMLAPIAQSQAGVHDLALVPWTTLALVCLRRADRAERRGAAIRALAAASGLLALALLTKGFAGIAMVLLATAVTLAIARRITMRRVMAVAACVAFAIVLASPWYIGMEAANPGYLRYYFVERHLLGYATGAARHAGRPWWYYLPILCAGGLPWSLYLPFAVERRVSTTGGKDEAVRGATASVWAWLGIGLLFLGVGQVKLWTYALPLFPALAILAARPWVRLLAAPAAPASDRGRGLHHAVIVHALLASALLPAGGLIARGRYGVALPFIIWPCAVGIALMAMRARTAYARGLPGVAFAAFAATAVATMMVMVALVMPPMAETLSARDLAQHFNRAGRLPAHLLVIDDRSASLVFYLEPSLRRGLAPGRIEPVTMAGAPERIAAAPLDTVIAVRERRVRRFDGLMHVAGLPFVRAGGFRLYPVPALQAVAQGTR